MVVAQPPCSCSSLSSLPFCAFTNIASNSMAALLTIGGELIYRVSVRLQGGAVGPLDGESAGAECSISPTSSTDVDAVSTDGGPAVEPHALKTWVASTVNMESELNGDGDPGPSRGVSGILSGSDMELVEAGTVAVGCVDGSEQARGHERVLSMLVAECDKVAETASSKVCSFAICFLVCLPCMTTAVDPSKTKGSTENLVRSYQRVPFFAGVKGGGMWGLPLILGSFFCPIVNVVANLGCLVSTGCGK